MHWENITKDSDYFTKSLTHNESVGIPDDDDDNQILITIAIIMYYLLHKGKQKPQETKYYILGPGYFDCFAHFPNHA